MTDNIWRKTFGLAQSQEATIEIPNGTTYLRVVPRGPIRARSENPAFFRTLASDVPLEVEANVPELTLGGANEQKFYGMCRGAGGHVVGLRQGNNTLWACGANDKGQLGDGTTTYRKQFVQIGLDTWLYLAAGRNYTLGVRSDGTLWAWGANESGQLGIGVTDGDPHPTPVQIGLDTDWQYVWTHTSSPEGEAFVAALKQGSWWLNQPIWAWGVNDWGQLGTGDTIPQYTPVLSTGPGATKVACGGRHMLARRVDMTLWSCGANDWGQLGTGAADGLPHSSWEQEVTVGTWQEDIACGQAHSLAGTGLSSATWGCNTKGQLGFGPEDALPHPTPVPGPWGANLAAGGDTSCMLLNGTSTVSCGGNDYGQLGQGLPPDFDPHPSWEPLAAPTTPVYLYAPSISTTGGFGYDVGADSLNWWWGTDLTQQGFPNTGTPTLLTVSVEVVLNRVNASDTVTLTIG